MMISRDAGLTGGVGSPEMTDAERRIADLIKTGVVFAVDYATPARPRVRVRIGDDTDAESLIETGWLPLRGRRAGNGESEWDPPEIGEVVDVLCESGEVQCGVVLPGSGYTTENPACGAIVGLWRRRFKDGTVMEYDRATKAFRVSGATGATITHVVGNASVAISGTQVEMMVSGVGIRVTSSGVEFVGGTVQHDSVNVGKTHRHGGVQGGLQISGVPQ